ncbi:hypothetical protein AOL_s00043g86 [Orbilia oligospora ATCC 24927]|uniref:ER membrane protein complex subunit 7 beta-sandwich domain-containing protein n=2 Tax=Orbilia oligospora TaxID=2813651 RepID=G1X313_ARTOA|nr:hypothetical protein AOL_s00043g86 [Orbilia oligospora ATCC 24927]EGX52297.1 hypothetical protein AOL_s00043g86 [Orbilia oligospora ATCC 24927]KAF3273721.1 hypothetical protein TWF970_008917 [Orbilia oligospora]
MRFLSSLFLVASLSTTVLANAGGKAPDNFPLPADFDHVNRSPPQTFVLNRWPLSAGDDTKQQAPLGMLRYVANTLSATYTPFEGLSEPIPDEAYRVGLLKGGKWIGGVRTGKILQSNYAATWTLHVDEKGEIFHAEYDAVELAPTAQKPETEIVIIRPYEGAKPALNRPVVLMPDGRLPQKEEEKTFLQKYWWLLAAGMVLLAAAPGEGGK